MTLFRLELQDFRCYPEAAFAFSPGINVIAGPNGAGKTCLLEAVSYLSAARSPRTHREREMIRHGEERASVRAGFYAGGRERLLEADIHFQARRSLRADGAALRSPRELLGLLPSVCFEPGDLMLLRGGAAERRKLMDAALCQLRPRYLTLLAAYRKLTDAKGRLLRASADKPDFLDALPEFDERIARTGAELCVYRAEFCRSLSREAARHHGLISGEKECLNLEYKTHAADAEETLRHIVQRRPAELAQGTCLVGAHRDDMIVHLDGRDIRSFGSQGQTRTAVIALKLAERDLFARAFGEPPVLLLDDVLSELDAGRRDYILHSLGDGQALITCCDPEGLTKAAGGKNIVLAGYKNL